MNRTSARLVALILVIANFGSTPAMNDSRRHLEEAKNHASTFENTLDAESLHKAYLALENVDPSREQGHTRAVLRGESLKTWLHLLALIDQHIDPAFDIEDTPDLQVQPPETIDGTMYPPGVDPALIDDPVARSKYEQEIVDNQGKVDRYNLQVRLHRMNDRISSRAEAFIRTAYTATDDDVQEVVHAISSADLAPERETNLLTLFTSGP